MTGVDACLRDGLSRGLRHIVGLRTERRTCVDIGIKEPERNVHRLDLLDAVRVLECIGEQPPALVELLERGDSVLFRLFERNDDCRAQPPVNPAAQRNKLTEDDWWGTRGLAEDVRYYGEWMKQRAFERIGHLYPKVKDADGVEHTVIASLWTRTVKCPNPACACEMPLASSFELSKKKGKEAYIQPIIEGTHIRYEVRQGKGAPEPPKMGRGAKFRCLCCGEMATPEYIKTEATAERMGADLMGIVAEGVNGRTYLPADEVQTNAATVHKPTDVPVQPLANAPHNIWCTNYGLDTFDKLFTNRQLLALTTFSELVAEARAQVEADGGSMEYAQAVSIFLALSIGKLQV